MPLDAVVTVLFVNVCVSVTPTIALPGAVNPLCSCAFRLVTTDVLAIENGAVPVDTLLTTCWPNVCVPVQVLLESSARKYESAPLPGCAG